MLGALPGWRSASSFTAGGRTALRFTDQAGRSWRRGGSLAAEVRGGQPLIYRDVIYLPLFISIDVGKHD